MPPTNEIALAVLFIIGVAMAMILLAELAFYSLKAALCILTGHNWKNYLTIGGGKCTRCGKGK